MPGIGPKTADRLEKMGLATLAALAATPDELLAQAFGARQGPWLRRRAQFHSADVVDPVRVAVSESRETTFDTDVGDRARQQQILLDLATRLCADLARQERRGRTIAIKVRLDDFTTITRARTIPQATNEPAVVGAVALELLRDYGPARPVRLLGVRVASFGIATAKSADDQLVLPVEM